MKTCTKCKVAQPLSAFVKNRERPDGFSVHCSTCKRAYRLKYQENHATPEWKTCSRCKTEKPAADFHKKSSHMDGLSSSCRYCTKAAVAALYAENRESRLEVSRRYYAANREARLQYQERYKVENAAAIAERKALNRDHILSIRRAWRGRNSDKDVSVRARRLKIALHAEPVDRDYIIERDGGICHICGKRPPPHLIHLDHLVPISKGGSHTAANLRVACQGCNCSRGAGRLPAQLLIFG